TIGQHGPDHNGVRIALADSGGEGSLEGSEGFGLVAAEVGLVGRRPGHWMVTQPAGGGPYESGPRLLVVVQGRLGKDGHAFEPTGQRRGRGKLVIGRVGEEATGVGEVRPTALAQAAATAGVAAGRLPGATTGGHADEPQR